MVNKEISGEIVDFEIIQLKTFLLYVLKVMSWRWSMTKQRANPFIYLYWKKIIQLIKKKKKKKKKLISQSVN